MKLSYFMVSCLILAIVSFVSSQSSDHQNVSTVSTEGSKPPMPRSLFTDMMDLVLSLYTKDSNGTLSATGLKSPLSRAVKASTSTITSLSYGKFLHPFRIKFFFEKCLGTSAAFSRNDYLF